MLAILLLDENISPNIVEELWRNGVDALHIRDRNLLEAADHEIWRLANQENRAVVRSLPVSIPPPWRQPDRVTQR